MWTIWPVCDSHVRPVPSAPAVAIEVPSGLIEHPLTGPSCPLNGPRADPVDLRQTLAVPSAPVVTNHAPFRYRCGHVRCAVAAVTSGWLVWS
jgi:hypothetical protein